MTERLRGPRERPLCVGDDARIRTMLILGDAPYARFEIARQIDGDAPARAVIEEQDRLIADKSGAPALAVKSIHRTGSKKAEEATRSPRDASASNL